MPEIKNTFLKSKMNKDLDSRIIGNGEYRDAQNASVSASEDASVGSLENIRGNQLLSFFNISDNNIEIIGQYSDTANNRMFFFLTNFSDSSIDSLSNLSQTTASTPEPGAGGFLEPGLGNFYNFNRQGASHYICYCQLPNVRSSSEISISNITSRILVSGDFLNFSKTHPMSGINVIENLLFWTDNRNQPRKINIETAINNPFISTQEPGYYYSEDHISVAKYAPYSTISFVKNFITGAYQSTLLNEKDEWLPPFFAAPGNVDSSTTPNQLQFNSSQGSTASQAVSNVSTFLGNTATSPWVNNNIRVQPSSDSAADYAFIFSISTANNYLILKSTSGIINDLSTLSGWPKEVGGVNTPAVFNFSMKNPNYNPSFAGDKDFLEDKFTRFSYRFKYDDNEYSLSAPFSQHTFVPKQFGYFLTGDTTKTKDSSIVKFMENQITSAELVIDLPFAPNEITDKLKVKEIQILYKASEDQNVKIIQDIDISSPSLQLGSPKTYSVVDAGSSQTNGFYKQIPLTGGTGTGALMDARVAGGTLVNLSTSNVQTSPIPNTGSLLKGAIPASNWTSTATSATVNTTATIGPTGGSGGSYNPPNKRFASFEITTDNTGAVSSVKVLNGGGGYVSGNVLILTLGIAFGGSGSGTITLTISKSMIAGDINGEGYKAGDILTFASLGGVGTGGTVKVDSLTNTFLYKYNSEKPIKVLTDKEVTRVSDIVPMRAQTQEAVGNRIVYGNFLQNKSTPSINYSLDIQNKGIGTSISDIEHNNNTLKQGRSYQVGLVLQDRYGRSSNVIVNNNSSLNSTIFNEYTNAGTNPLSWLGNSLKITFEDSISSTFSPEGNGFYSETNPLGWYTYKVVVQQQEQEYYNVYTAGGLSGNIVYTKNDAEIIIGDKTGSDFVTIDGLRYSNENEAFQIALFNDNINKIPRELKEIGDTDEIFSSNIYLYNRVKNNNYNTSAGGDDDQNLSTQNESFNTLKQEVVTVKSFKELGQWTSYKNVDLHYLNIDPFTGASQFAIDTFIYPGAKGGVDPFYLKNNQNPLIATISTSSRMGFTSDMQESSLTGTTASESVFAKSLMVFETKPFKSSLEIFYETSTCDLISKLNQDISDDIDPSGDTVLGFIEDVSVTSWLENTLANTSITNEFTALNSNGDPLSGAVSQSLLIDILSVRPSASGSAALSPQNLFVCEVSTPASAPSTPPFFRIKLSPNFEGIAYDIDSNVNDSYFVTLEARSNNQSIQKVVTLKLGNVQPEIYRFQGLGPQQVINDNTLDGFNGFNVPLQALLPGDDILLKFLKSSIDGDSNFPPLSTAAMPDVPLNNRVGSDFYTQVMNCQGLKSNNPFGLLDGTYDYYPLGFVVGYISHFSNGFRTLDNIPIAPDYLPNAQQSSLKTNDTYYVDQSTPTSSDFNPKSIIGLEPVIESAIRYRAFYDRTGVYGTPQPYNFTTFVARGGASSLGDPLAQINSGDAPLRSQLDPRDARGDFYFDTGTQNRFQTGSSKQIMRLIYRPQGYNLYYNNWHGNLFRQGFKNDWWPAWYYQIKIKLVDASGGTGSQSSSPFYCVNFLVMGDSNP